MPEQSHRTPAVESSESTAVTESEVAGPSNSEIQETVVGNNAPHKPSGPLPPFVELLPEADDLGLVQQEERTRTMPASAAKDPVGGTGAAPEAEMSSIGSNVAIGRFVGAAKSVQSNWGKLSPQERRTSLRVQRTTS